MPLSQYPADKARICVVSEKRLFPLPIVSKTTSITVMSAVSLLERDVLLATGVRLPLFPVATIILTIGTMLSGTESDREELIALRKASLDGSPVDERFAQGFLAKGFIRPDDRRVERMTRHIVLAAIRGEENELYLDSPCVNRQDRTMVDLIISATKAQAILTPEQVASLLVPPDDGLGPWARRVNKGTGQNPIGPTPSVN